jgi:uncharacterized membrane protein YoaK (UPF0700 family)
MSATARTASAPNTVTESLRVAALLTFAGGFLDAFTFVGHGRVFANAMTGNVVLLGISAADGDWITARHRALPIVAFLAGVFAAHLIRVRNDGQHPARAGRYALLLELVLLTVVAFLPRDFPDSPIVLGIAFVAALQSTVFSRLRGMVYNSTMTTGNLRRSAELLYAGVLPRRDAATLRQAGLFAAICGCFLLGAVAGGLATPVLRNAAVVVPIAALVLVLAMNLAAERRLRRGR